VESAPRAYKLKASNAAPPISTITRTCPTTAIKPVHNIGGGTKYFIEDEEDKVTYTLDKLREIVGTLERNFVNFQEYAAGIGLISSNAV
jgi:hypothetical protein